MNSTTMLVILSIIAGIVALIVLVLVIRRSQVLQLPKSAHGGRSSISSVPDPIMDMQIDVDPRLDSDELQASPVSEKIEDMVKNKLREYPDLRDVVIDFGASPDGSLEIWIDSERYLDIEEIPDRRIREAIAKAVEDFNA